MGSAGLTERVALAVGSGVVGTLGAVGYWLVVQGE